MFPFILLNWLSFHLNHYRKNGFCGRPWLGYLRLYNSIKTECSWVHETFMKLFELLINSCMDLYPKLLISHYKLIIVTLGVRIVAI